MDSILNTVKKACGLDEDYTAFDHDILLFINSAMGTLNQIGIGPVNGLFIEDASTTWAQFLDDDPLLNPAKTYVYLRVRMLFDPPQTSFHIAAMEKQIEQHEFRLNVYREGKLHPIVEVVV